MKSHEILKQYFHRKQEINPSYSLRALARHTQVAPSYLSAVFSGKKSISDKIFQKLVRHLELDKSTVLSVRKALAIENINDVELVEELKLSTKGNAVQKYKPISNKKISLLQKWYYVAVLDLMTCADFKSDYQWIARRLGILQGEAEEAVDVLKKLDIIENHKTGWRKKSLKLRIPTARSQEEIRKFHKQMIEKALTELQFKTQQENFEKRVIAGITFAGNPKKLNRAKEKLNEVLHEIASDLMEGECTEVYQLNFQFFPLTK